MSWMSTFLRGKVFAIAMSAWVSMKEMGNYLQGSMWGLNVYLNLIVNKGHSPVLHVKRAGRGSLVFPSFFISLDGVILTFH